MPCQARRSSRHTHLAAARVGGTRSLSPTWAERRGTQKRSYVERARYSYGLAPSPDILKEEQSLMQQLTDVQARRRYDWQTNIKPGKLFTAQFEEDGFLVVATIEVDREYQQGRNDKYFGAFTDSFQP